MQMTDQGFTANAQKAAAHLSWGSIVVILLIIGVLVYNIYKTIYYEKEIAAKLTDNKAIILQQQTPETVQYIYRNVS